MGLFLYSRPGLEQRRRKIERPPLPAPHIAFLRAAPRRAARGEKKRGNLRNRERDGNSYAPRLRTYTQPAQLFAAGAQLAAHTQPVPRTGPMSPAWRMLHAPQRAILDLTW